MNQKEILKKYLITLYEIYKKNNYENFNNYCYSYNIKIGNYNKKINSLSKKVFDAIIAFLTENKVKNAYKEYNNFYKVSAYFVKNNYPTPKVSMDIPVFEENYQIISLLLVQFMAENNINFNIKLLKNHKNPIFEIKVDDVLSAKKIINEFESNEKIKNEIKSRVMPFIPQINLIGIYYDYKPYNFKCFLIKTLYEYYSKIEVIDDETVLDDFQIYLENIYKKERKLNKKRMYYSLYNSIKIINNDNNAFELFRYNSNLELSSIDSNYCNLKKDSNNMIYFLNKDDNMNISFGSEDFLNITYSKFYENIMKKEKNDTYYNYFYNIYSKILSDNYKDIEKYLDFSNINNDDIYQKMMLISSAYFAYKKMDFTLENINEILVYVFFKVYKIKLNLKNRSEKEIALSDYFPLSIEYGNKVIDLKNNTKTTIKDYFRTYNVLKTISMTSKVYLKDGNIILGKDFLYNLYIYIGKYENFKELINDMVSIIEFD